jgi:hypothetical protein
LPPIVVHHRHRRRCRCHWAATASTATPVAKLAIIKCRRKRQQQQHRQCSNGSTNVETYTSPDDLDLFNLSTVFEVFDDGRGNLAISNLLAKKKRTFFAIYILGDESPYIFGRWCVVPYTRGALMGWRNFSKTAEKKFLQPTRSGCLKAEICTPVSQQYGSTCM